MPLKTKRRRRTRIDPRRALTRTALIEKAEALFARDGVEGVSLRQLGAAVGSGNKNVIAYHFGSKEALVEAIFLHRDPPLEVRRAELLAALKRARRERDVAALIHALWYPLFEQVNDDGLHSYAAFLASMRRANWPRVRKAREEPRPATTEIARLMKQAVPKNAKRYFSERLMFTIAIVATALQYCDDNYPAASERARKLFLDALRTATATMIVPDSDAGTGAL